MGMLVLGRLPSESIVIPELGIKIMVCEIKGRLIRIGIDAPRELRVYREEVWNEIQAKEKDGGS